MGKSGGIFFVIVGILYVILFVVIIAVFVGVLAVIYLIEYVKKGKVVEFIRFGIEILVGIFFIIYGFFGFVFFVIVFGFRWFILLGVFIFLIMILFIIIWILEEVIKIVLMFFREGSFVFGVIKW